MSQKVKPKGTDSPIKSHIINEGKYPASKTSFNFSNQSTSNRLELIVIKWQTNNTFTNVFS